MENYRKIDKVGEGTYGKVYMAKDCRNGNTVALKKIQMGADGIPFTAIREIALLKGVSRPNIIRLLDILTSDCSIYLVFEYLEYDLKKYMDQFSEGLPPAMVKNYMRQLLKGIGYCHSRRIIHRDLKPQNLLIDKEGGIKIADFGLSRTVGILSETFTHEVVTLWYRCPEIILGSKFYGFGIDIWSLACIFAEMAHKKVLFKGDSEIDQLFKIFRILGTPDEKSWPCLTSLSHYNVSFPKWLPVNMRGILPHLGKDALDLIQAMLAYDSKSRISAKDALNHKYFKEQIPILQTAQASYVTIL